MNNNELNENTRYTYGFEPHTSPAPRKKHMGIKIAALLLSCMLIGTSGGVLGAYLLMSSSPAASDTAETANTQILEQSPSLIENLTMIANNKLTLQEIYAKCNPAVVAISTEIIGRNAFGQVVNLPSSGSGFIISSDGYIVTNNHVIDGVSAIKAHLSDGRSFDAKVIGSDSYTDLAVLKIEASGLTHLTFGDSDKVLVGDLAAAIGNPLGQLANTFTVGYISSLDREINADGIPRTMMQTDAAVNRGNSGGPLLSEYGYVIGVVSAKSSGSGVEGLGFAIPSNLAENVVNQLIENGYVKGRPIMGISVSMARYGFGQTALQIAEVTPGGGADKAGIREGDYIIDIDGKQISTRDELLGVLYSRKAGDTVKVTVQRDQETKTFNVTLSAMD